MSFFFAIAAALFAFHAVIDLGFVLCMLIVMRTEQWNRAQLDRHNYHVRHLLINSFLAMSCLIFLNVSL